MHVCGCVEIGLGLGERKGISGRFRGEIEHSVRKIEHGSKHVFVRYKARCGIPIIREDIRCPLKTRLDAVEEINYGKEICCKNKLRT